MWLEVETKVHVKNPDKLRKKIKTIANFGKKEIKEDNYFALRRRFGWNRSPKKAFRIRKKSNTYEINFKKWLKEYWDKEVVVKQEFEFSIKDKEHLENLLALFRDLGFVEWTKKKKHSETYYHKKDKRISIELNNVEHLGYFMEVEYLCQYNEIEKAKRKIKETLKELGIEKRNIDNTGYTKMLWKKKIKNN